MQNEYSGSQTKHLLFYDFWKNRKKKLSLIKFHPVQLCNHVFFSQGSNPVQLVITNYTSGTLVCFRPYETSSKAKHNQTTTMYIFGTIDNHRADLALHRIHRCLPTSLQATKSFNGTHPIHASYWFQTAITL